MFNSRSQAAELLAQQLKQKGYGGKDTLVLAIPRGGVVTGQVIAKGLGLPLDVVITRKIPAPNQPELALGAVGPGGTRVIDVGIAERTGADEEYLKKKIEQLKREVEERDRKFRGKRKAIQVEGKTIVLVDDGVATGATVETAVRYLRTKKPKEVVIATPVASVDSVEKLKQLVDDIVVLETPEEFMAVGQFYRDFPQVTDDEVIKLLSD